MGDLDVVRQRVLSIGGMKVGHTASGAPSVGKYHAGDVNVDLAGPYVEVCTADGTPGTWSDLVAKGKPLTGSLSGNVALNNTANYFDGPSVAQGVTGTWFASGTVTVQDTGGAANFSVKLWDGTTVIASAQLHEAAANAPQPVSLSGCISSPAGNIRISVKDADTTTGQILFNASGNSKDSTITAILVG